MDYTTIKVPKPLTDAIDKVIRNTDYRNRSEFIIDATRRMLEKMRDDH